jgi:hypothetical protein
LCLRTVCRSFLYFSTLISHWTLQHLALGETQPVSLAATHLYSRSLAHLLEEHQPHLHLPADLLFEASILVAFSY